MAITQTYVDYGAGNDYNGASFTDGAYTSATKVLAKNGAFTKTKVNHWLYLSSNAGGSIVAGYYKVATATDANSVILATDAGGGVDATDVKCTQATGTALLPFRSIQGALDIITRDATNGDQINVNAGTAQVNQAALTLVTYGAPAEGVPLIFEGYTTSAQDGGIGEIDCNGATMFAANSYAALVLIDLQIHNFGNNNGIVLSGTAVGPSIIRCNIHKGASTPSSKILVNCINGRVVNSYIHDAGTGGTGLQGLSQFLFNYISGCAAGIVMNNSSGVAYGNIIVDSTSAAISIAQDHIAVINNTIYSSTAATGNGIQNTAGSSMSVILNNVIEGYSGAGGKGISTAAADVSLLGYNAFFNNATPESLGDVYLDLGNDVTLGASPFTNKAVGNFSVSTALKALGFPASFLGAATNTYIDIGAAQRQEPAGGAVSISPTLGSVGAA